MVLIRQKQN